MRLSKGSYSALAFLLLVLCIGIGCRVFYLPETLRPATTSYIPGGIGIAAATFATVAAIALVTKESCPFVSVYDGKDYDVDAEGYVNACPFCRSRSYHVKDVIGKGAAALQVVMGCPDYAPDHH